MPDVDALDLYKATRRHWLWQRNAMSATDADTDVAAWLAVRCAEVGVGTPAGNARHQGGAMLNRFLALLSLASPDCRRVIELKAAGNHETARGVLGQVLDLMTTEDEA